MTLNLSCHKCVTRECEKKISCRHVDRLLGTGKVWPKRKTYSVDFMRIVNPKETLNPFQVKVLGVIKAIGMGKQDQLLSKLILEEVISTLSEREQIIVQLFREKYKQKEIAEKLGISQQRVDFLLKRIFKKLGKYGKEEL